MSRLVRLAAAALPIVLSFAVASCGKPPAPASAPPPVPSARAAVPAPKGDGAFRERRPPAGAIVPHEYPPVETARLGNGLSLFVVHRPAGVVSLSLVARSHASRLPPKKSGLAAFSMRMMTEGTTKKNSLRLAEAVESLGSSLEQSASRDFVRLGLTTLPENVKDGLSLLTEVATRPSFPAGDLERVRREWLDAIEAERQAPARLSSLVGLRLLLGEQIGAPVSGSRRDVAGLRRDDLVAFHRATFVPDNVALVAVGDVTLEAVRLAAEPLLGALKGTPSDEARPPEAAAPTDGGKVVHVVDRPGAVQSALFIGQPFPRRGEPGHEARELLNDLFGGLFTSRLMTNLREEHAYTYGARSLQMATHDWGGLAILTSVRTDVTAEALGEALSELRKIGGAAPVLPPKDVEVARARIDLKQQLGQSLSDVGEIAGNVEELFVQGLAPDYLKKYPSLLDGISPAEISAECKRIDVARSVIVVVGDSKVVTPALAARGFNVRTVSESLTD